MPLPPPRRRFQCHLSTAIVLMFTAGFLIWANVMSNLEKTFNVERVHFEGSFAEFKKHMEGDLHDWNTDPGTANFVERYGWPLSVITNTNTYFAPNNDPSYDQIATSRMQSNLAACIDAITALGIIFSVWFACEWRIRHRAARKES